MPLGDKKDFKNCLESVNTALNFADKIDKDSSTI